MFCLVICYVLNRLTSVIRNRKQDPFVLSFYSSIHTEPTTNHLFRMGYKACRKHDDTKVRCRISVHFFNGSDFHKSEIKKALYNDYKHITSLFSKKHSSSPTEESARSALVHVYAHKNDN